MLRATVDAALSARITGSWPLPGVRSGSGLVFVGRRLLVVQDDVAAVALLDPSSLLSTEPRAPKCEVRVLVGDGAPVAKADKLDLEAALVGHDGAIYVLGSGSAAKRRRIARLVDAAKHVEIVDAGALYDALAAALGVTPNIEGAVLEGDRLVLFHRGSRADPSATVACSPAALDGGAPGPCSVLRYDLGRVAGVPLTFTDAATASGGTTVYLAVAEDTPNAIDDGPVVGAAVGLLAASGEARYAVLLEPDGRPTVRKVEGLALDGAEAWLVTDPDDPARPSELCRLALEGGWT